MKNFRKVVKKVIPKKIFKNIEPYGHLAESVVANTINGFPAKKMHVIGVTGTNGKTTTTFLIQRMLYEAGYKVGMLSTVAYGYGKDIRPQIEHATTADAFTSQRRLREFEKAGVEWVVVETSSHSLAQSRIWGLPYEIAVLTNVTNDHLDYHGTFENYSEAKRKLFKIAAKNGRKFGVINADDSSFERFSKTTPRTVSYGIKAGDLRASNIKLTAEKSTYTASIGKEKYDITINIPGEFNVSNSLAAVAVGRELGLTKQQIEKGIAALEGVEGRMTVIDEGQPFKYIVDFASTPDAFEKFFECVRPLTKGKLIAIFGSAGRRDEAKRAIQGEIAGRFCDEVILTEEDNRDVDGAMILEQIAEGAERAGKIRDKDMFLILDREEAVKFAVTRAKSANDMVALLGKGHDKTIEHADGEHPWSELEISKNALKALKK